MDISFNGFNEEVLTFIADSSVTEGALVKMKASGTVEKASDGDGFIGVCLNVRNGYAAVQVEGYVECAFSGTADVGSAVLTAASTGVKSSASGKEYRIIFKDAGKIGFLL